MHRSVIQKERRQEMNNISFANPGFLWLLVIVPMLVVFYLLFNKKRTLFQPLVTSCLLLSSNLESGNMYGISFSARMLIIILLVIIIARPQSTDKWQDVSSEGIDIMLVMDISGSMLARIYA
ncbi:MAG: BatA domain-containing protein [Bacteroidales bacterium]